MRDRLRVIVAGGGTGGHLYPGIAVARELLSRRPDAIVTFAGTERGIESRVVPREGFELDTIRSLGLKGKSIVGRLKASALIPIGLLDAAGIVSRRRPQLVIGVGGYSSGPVVLFAALRGVPTMLLEQNAVPGLTNRLLGRVVRAAAVTYESTAKFFGAKAFVSGNPVRAEFVSGVESASPADEPRGERHLLVFGGSQGAHAINQLMVDAAPTLARTVPMLHVTHQTGERDLSVVKNAYTEAGLRADVEPFLYDMGARLGQADLVVCRSGATTLAELTAAGKASVLIPLPTATDDHQRKNAEVLGAAGAAEVVLQGGATGQLLAERIARLLENGDLRRRMGTAARVLAKPHAARHIVDRALALAGA